MTDFANSNTRTSEAALLEKVRRYVEEECAAIEAEAQERAHGIIAQAHASARAGVHDEITRIRRQSELQIEKQAARIHTARRHDLYDQENKFLNTVWPQLDQVMQKRWDDPIKRRNWLEQIVTTAVERLHSGRWVVEHPKDWNTDELTPFMDLIHSVQGVTIAFQSNADLRAGLCIRANGAVLDGTLRGLTLDRRTISAVFLSEIFTQAEAKA